MPPAVTSAIDATGITYEINDSFENGLSGDFPWHTTEDMPWTVKEDDVSDGKFAAWSKPGLEAGEMSDLHVAIQTKHGGTLFFDFKTQVRMPWSGSYINLDGESKKGYTFAKPDWMELSLPIPEGEHVVMFRAWAPTLGKPDVEPDVSGTIGLDNVSFMPNLVEGFEEEGGELALDGMEFDGTPWTFDSTEHHEGDVSLKSPDGKSSTLEFDLTVPRRGSDISFWYKSGVTMPSDRFTFKINGRMLLVVTKVETEWTQFTNSLPPGNDYILEWEYLKMGDGGGGSVWIDDIEIMAKA